MKKQLIRLGLFSLAVLAFLPDGPVSAAPAPVRLRLTVEKETMSADAQGKPKIAWTALTDTTGGVHPGDLLRYRVQAENTGTVPVADLLVTQPVPAGTEFIAGSTDGEAAIYSLDSKHFSPQPVQEEVEADGVTRTHPAPPESYVALRWRFPALAAKATETVTYQVRVR